MAGDEEDDGVWVEAETRVIHRQAEGSSVSHVPVTVTNAWQKTVKGKRLIFGS